MASLAPANAYAAPHVEDSAATKRDVRENRLAIAFKGLPRRPAAGLAEDTMRHEALRTTYSNPAMVGPELHSGKADRNETADLTALSLS
jgi:hypothetical protein